MEIAAYHRLQFEGIPALAKVTVTLIQNKPHILILQKFRY